MGVSSASSLKPKGTLLSSLARQQTRRELSTEAQAPHTGKGSTSAHSRKPEEQLPQQIFKSFTNKVVYLNNFIRERKK